MASGESPAKLIETRVVAKSSETDYYAFPSICKTASGELLCVFYCGTGHVSPDGKVAMVRSSDEGKTWSRPEIVVDTPQDDRDPSIMQTKSGRILINFFVLDGVNWHNLQNRATRESPRVHVAWSDDNGKTFTKPRPIDVGWTWNATSDEVVQLPDGTLLLPFYGRTAGDKADRAAVAFSKDNGETWNAEPWAKLAYDENGVIAFQEPALVLLPDGTIICSLRTTNAGFHAFESRSRDGGRTWSKPVDTFLHGHAANLLYHSSGVIFHAYRSWSQKGTVLGAAAVFGEPGKPWNPAREFPLVQVGGDVAYPSAVELSDGSIYCVYYTREHRTIEAAVIPPESIAALR